MKCTSTYVVFKIYIFFKQSCVATPLRVASKRRLQNIHNSCAQDLRCSSEQTPTEKWVF